MRHQTKKELEAVYKSEKGGISPERYEALGIGIEAATFALSLATMPLGVRDDLADYLEDDINQPPNPLAQGSEKRAIAEALIASLRRPPDAHRDGTLVGTAEEELGDRG